MTPGSCRCTILPAAAAWIHFKDTILGEATDIAVKQTAEKLVAARARLQ